MGDIKGVILCGGKGTRLRPLTYYFQKSMIPVGMRQKPLLEYIVRLLSYHGIEKIVLLVDYKAEQIINYFDDGSRFGVKIQYLKDDPRYPGNAGALYNAYIRGYLGDSHNIVVYYGDILSNINISELLRIHKDREAAATLALSENYTVSVGVAELRGSRIVKLVEKPPLGKPAVMGILALKTDVVGLVEELLDYGGQTDIMRDLVPLLIRRGLRVEAYVTEAFWYDVGSTERYEKLDQREVDELLAFVFADEKVSTMGRPSPGPKP